MKRLAVVGAGLIGRRHIEAIDRAAGARISHIVDPSHASKAEAAKRDVPWSASIADMLSGAPPDGVIIATPNNLHVSGGLECIEAGLPILVEKPIADSTASAQRLVDAASRQDIPVLVGHHRRHNPIISAAKAQIESRAVGSVVAVHVQCWFHKPDDYFDTAWRTQKGAGPVFINLIHDIDLMRHLVGHIASVYAITSNHTRGHMVEDTAVVAVRFQDGALGTITVSDAIVAPWSWELTSAENPAYPATGQSCYHIGGTRGSLEIPTGRIWSQDDAPNWWKPIEQRVEVVDPIDPLDAQIAHFCDVIDGSTPLVSGAEGLASLHVIEAISQSAHTGLPVALS